MPVERKKRQRLPLPVYSRTDLPSTPRTIGRNLPSHRSARTRIYSPSSRNQPSRSLSEPSPRREPISKKLQTRNPEHRLKTNCLALDKHPAPALASLGPPRI